MPELPDPVPAHLDALLDALVREHRAGERRRRHPAAVQARRSDGLRARFDAPWAGPPGRAPLDGAGPDHATRCDVVGRLLDLVSASAGAAERPGPGPLLWLTRPEAQEDPDEDRAWLAAVLGAAAERGLDPWWVVVTREGWHDPRSGVRRRLPAGAE